MSNLKPVAYEVERQLLTRKGTLIYTYEEFVRMPKRGKLLASGAAIPLYAIPEGYALVPISTTSEQKYFVNGEFGITETVDCHDCDPDDFDPECEECGGEGSYEHKRTIPWTTCKDIYAAMLKAGGVK